MTVLGKDSFMIRAGSFLVLSLVLGITFAFVHSVSVAQPQQARKARNQAEPAEAEQLEPHQISVQKSRVYILVDKTGLGHQHGVEGRLKSGSLILGAVEDAGVLVFDMNSFDADTDAARRYVGLSRSTDASTRRQVNDNMKNTSILNVSQFPTARFAIKSATLLEKKSRSGSPLYELTGEFTLRGKTRPIKIEAEAEQKDNMTHVCGRFAILQTQYGITPFRKALGAVGVADQLIIHGDLWIAAGDAP
jgi:polyisoprenoid-binding protein YceI